MTQQIPDLPDAWIQPRTTAQLHLLQARAAPKAVIIRRNPSKWFHLMCWDTQTDTITHGSWFKGKLYAKRCDLSWDGNWMVYLAMGSKGHTWNGICRPPWLRTEVDVPNFGSWAGGGVFTGRRTLMANDARCSERSLSEFSKRKQLPFSIERLDSGGEDFPILGYRLERDGWVREGHMGRDREIRLKHSTYSSLCEADPGWSWQLTPRHPVLRMFYRGYLVRGYTFEFQLEGSDLLDPDVEWATWTCQGDLLVARKGTVLRYSLQGLRTGVPDFSLDLEPLCPPGSGR